MESHVERPLRLPELAVRAGCSQRDLETRFTRAFGASPRKVYSQIRLTTAHRLVTETNLTDET